MIKITLFSLLLMNLTHAENPDWITGTWMVVSHQTVSVFHYKEDGTFSGTYITPGLDVKSVMEGTWRLENDKLFTTWLKSDLPFMSTPFHDEDRILKLDADRFQATGIKTPYQVNFSRVKFKDPKDVIRIVPPVKPELPPLVPAPNQDELRRFKEKDMWENNILLTHIFSLVDHAPEELFGDRVRHVLDKQLTEAAGYYYVTEIFYRMYSNGGMQNVLMSEADELDFELWQLKKVRDGFRYFGCLGQAKFLESQMENVKIWAKAIDRLIQLEKKGIDVPEADFDKVWDQVDALEQTWERIRDKDPIFYDQVLKDLKAHPDRYLK